MVNPTIHMRSEREGRNGDAASISGFQALQDRLQRLGLIAAGVGVVDAEDELSAEAARQQPVELGGADAADVEIAGRARSEARADRHGTPHTKRRDDSRTGRPALGFSSRPAVIPW